MPAVDMNKSFIKRFGERIGVLKALREAYPCK